MIDVYLDTQDYSRFDDVIAGRGKNSDSHVLDELDMLKQANIIRIAYSSMNLSELLQYDGGGRELTLRKARTVKHLAGTNAFIDAKKLLAMQIAITAHKAGRIRLRLPLDSPVSTDNGWYPDIGNVFQGFRSRLRERASQTARAFPANRKTRRAVVSKAVKFQVSDLPDEEFKILMDRYPFTPSIFKDVIARALDGKVPLATAERALFSEMADPERFVIWYFERHDGEKDFPFWMADLGQMLKRALENMREEMLPYIGNEIAIDMFDKWSSNHRINIAGQMMSALELDLKRFGVSGRQFVKLSTDPCLHEVPFFRTVESLLPAMIIDHSGLRPFPRRPRRSDGADIAHALVLPFCDVWRGDSYFAGLLARHAPPDSGTIVAKLEELPAAIRKLAYDRGLSIPS